VTGQFCGYECKGDISTSNQGCWEQASFRVARNTQVKRQRKPWLESWPFAVQYRRSGSQIWNPSPIGILDRV